ncbi:MAG: alpha/beta fold hydrolase [Actinomycetales bacterium]|nr:alpha/beta fold hydrolase [Actinomycetales bacterium]
MVSGGGEDVEGRREHLLPPLLAGQAGRSCSLGRGHTGILLTGNKHYPDLVTLSLVAWPREDHLLPTRTISARHAPGGSDGLPTAVFVHGLGGSSLNWTDLMGRLQEQVDGWAVDLGGFGWSPPPRDGDMSPAGHARSVAEFIEFLVAGGRAKAPVHLFGNSLGGAVALQLAARRPDLVRTLTLVSPALPSVFATRSNIHLPVIAVPGIGERLVPRYLEVDAAGRVQGTIDVTFADPTRISQQRLDEAEEEVRARDHLPYVSDAFLRSLRGLLRTFVDPGPNRPWRLARRVTCPTLVVYGRKDPLVDARSAHRVTKHFPNAHVLVLPDCGHVAQMEHPEFVAAAWERFCA